MSLDDLPEEEGWNPDDEKIGKKLLKRQLDIMDEVLRGMKEEREARGKQDMHQHGPDCTPPNPLGVIVAAITPSSNCQIRPISNGFIIRYLETKRVFSAGIAGQPMTPAVTIPRLVEAFSVDADGLLPHIMAALESMRLIYDLERQNGPTNV